MVKDYDDWQPKADKVDLQQEAVKRYRLLKKFKESELTLEDQLFLENFQSALYFWSSASNNLYIEQFVKQLQSFD